MQEKVSNHNAVGCIPDRVKNPTRMTWERAASTSVCQCQRESGAEVDYAFGAGNRYLSARASITCLRTGSCGSRVLRHGAWIAPSATLVRGRTRQLQQSMFRRDDGSGRCARSPVMARSVSGNGQGPRIPMEQHPACRYHIAPLEGSGTVADQWLGFAVRESRTLEHRPVLVSAAAEHR